MAGSVIYGALHPSGGEAWLRESPPAISRALCPMLGPKGAATAIGSRSGKLHVTVCALKQSMAQL